jgi:flagellar motility protein MotE (MotC chaperone)
MVQEDKKENSEDPEVTESMETLEHLEDLEDLEQWFRDNKELVLKASKKNSESLIDQYNLPKPLP